MAYAPAMIVAVLLMLCDVFFTAIRSTVRTGGDISTYVLLSVHEVIAVAEGVIIFAFFSYTVWFTAGLLGHLAFTVRVTIPLFVLRLFFIQMPQVYGRFLSGASREWDDPIYGILFCADIVSCIAMCVSLMYTVACLSERRMYAPYHTEWRPAGYSVEADTTQVRHAMSGGDRLSGPTAARSHAGQRALGPALVDPSSVFRQSMPQQDTPVGGIA